MKIVLCCAVFVAVLALSRAEECRSDSDCTHVKCPENDYRLDCHNRQCTCTHTGSSNACTTANDCGGSDCRFGWHCVDAICRCGFGFGGGGIGK